MKLLSDALLTSRTAEAVDLISRRLAGEHLDTPIAIQVGEYPREAVAALWRRADLTECVTHAILQLTETVGTDKLSCFLDNPDDPTNAAWLIELFGLLIDTETRHWPNGFMENCERLALRNPDASCVLEVQRLALFAFATLNRGSAISLALCFPALRSISSAGALALAAATADPSFFLKTFAPQVLTSFKDTGPEDADRLGFLGDALQNSVDLVLSEGGDPKEAGLSSFLKFAAHMSTHASGPAIREIVSSALARTDVDAEFIFEFEREYWREHVTIDLESNGLSRPLRNLVRSGSVGTSLKADTIRMNVFPYAEATFIRLYSHAMRAAYEVETSFVEAEYGKVLHALANGRINLAAHNGSIFRQGHAPLKANVLLRSVPLIHFKNYTVVASIPKLRSVSRQSDVPLMARQLAADLLDGEQLRRHEELDDSGKEVLAQLVRAAGLTYLSGTDTEKAAVAMFGPAASSGSSLPPDDGIVHLLNGEAGFYVGGALQSRYAIDACATRALEVAQIPDETHVHFYVLRSEYNRRKALYDQSVVTWRAVGDIWEWLLGRKFAPKTFFSLLAPLRDDLLAEINRQVGMGSGFAGTFKGLSEVLTQHDTLLPIPENPPYFTEVKPNGSPDSVIESAVNLDDEQIAQRERFRAKAQR